MDLILTNAHPGGLSFTIATFSSTGLNATISIGLMHSVKTGEFFKELPSETASEIEARRKYGWTRAEVALLGDYRATMAALTQTHLATLGQQGRTTNLTSQNLFNWLVSIWPSIRTYFVNSVRRGVPYTISLACPNLAPPSLVAEFSDLTVPEIAPAYIPALQVHVPPSIPFSELEIVDLNQFHKTHAKAAILYPTPGTQVLSGSPVMLSADQGLQATTTHRFTWYIPDNPVLSGIQVVTTFTSTVSMVVPVTLMVTNIATGISDAIVTYVNVEP